MEKKIDNSSTRIYVNKLENRITFKMITGNYLELWTRETMKLLGSTKNKITKDRNGENVPHLKIKKVVLIHCNIANNDYHQDSRVLYTLVPSKTFRSLLEISPTNSIFLKTFNSEFSYTEVLFKDQNSQPLEIEYRINLTFVIKWCSYNYKNALFNWT